MSVVIKVAVSSLVASLQPVKVVKLNYKSTGTSLM